MPTLCTVSGTLKNLSGETLANTTVGFYRKGVSSQYGDVVVNYDKQVTSNGSGFVSFDIYPGTYTGTFSPVSGRTETFTMQVPETAAEDIADLIGGPAEDITTGLSELTADLAAETAARIAGDDAHSEGAYYAGPWDASTGAFPAVRGAGGAVQSGDYFDVSVAGTVDGQAFEVGERIKALIDAPSTTTLAANWYYASTIAILEPLNDAVDEINAELDEFEAQLDAQYIVFDTVADLIADTTAVSVYRARYGDTGTVYVKTKKEGYEYSLDLAQAASGTGYITSAGGGVHFGVLRGEDGTSVKRFGAVGGAECGAELQAALNFGGALIFDGQFISDQALTVDATSVSLHFPSAYEDRIKVGPNFPEGSFLFTVTGDGRRQGGVATEQPNLTGNERFFSSKNMFLDGNGRARQAHGFRFLGQNDDAHMENTLIHDFKGTGFAGGWDDDEQTKFRESLLGDWHIKNCGNINDGADHAAFLLFANDEALPVGVINNITFENLRVIYPRGVGVRVLSVAPSDVGQIRSIHFKHLFLHGNRGLPDTTDPQGENWRSGRHLLEVGRSGATDFQVPMLSIGRIEAIEQEDGEVMMVVYDGAQLSVDDGYISSGAGRTGIRASGAGDIRIGSFMGRKSSVTNTTAPVNLIEVQSMQPQASVAINSVQGGTIPNGSASYVGDITYLKDAGRLVETYEHAEDAAATDTQVPWPFGQLATCATYINEIRIMPHGNVAANDTNYATFTLTARDTDGTGVGTSTIATWSTTTTDTGTWLTNQPIIITPDVSERLDRGQQLGLQITKAGSGVVLRDFSLQVIMSTNLKAGVAT